MSTTPVKTPKIDVGAEVVRCQAQYSKSAIKKEVDEVLTRMLLEKYTFYAQMISLAVIEINEKMPNTAAMSIRNAKPLFIFGSLFMTKYYTFKNRIADAVHEVEHFMRLHMVRMKNKQKPIWDIACDITINQLIQDIPAEPWSIFPSTYGLPKDKDENWYYYELLKIQKQQQKERKQKGNSDNPADGEPKAGDGQQQQGEGNNPADGEPKEGNGQQQPSHSPPKDSRGRAWLPDKARRHAGWDEMMAQADPSLMQEVARDLANRAATACKGKGDLPAHIQDLLDVLNQPPKLSWRTILRRYVGTVLKGRVKRTWARLNRRLSFAKGKMHLHRRRLVFAIDTSGSMSSKVIAESINELKAIQKLKEAELWLVHADAEVAYTGKLDDYTPVTHEVYGRGGTDFRPVFKWVEDKQVRPDLLVFLTDGAGNYPGKVPAYPVIWLMVEGSSPGVKWGLHIPFPEDDNKL